MSGPSFWWIDWSLHGREMRRETAGRFLLWFLAATYFLAMLLSGGVNRFLSEQYTMTAILRLGVPDGEGVGIAGKVALLPSVREAQYHTPEDAWEEFLTAYPGLDSLRRGGKPPLPGYVEVSLRPERMSEKGIADVMSALEPLAQVEKILSGGNVMPSLLRLKHRANIVLWAGFGLACVVFLVILAMQEKAGAARLLPDVSFLADRGTPGERIGARRAVGAFLTGGAIAILATASSFAFLYITSARFLFVRIVVGRAQELLDGRFAVPVALFLLSAATIQGLTSLAGWRAAFPKGK
jgi:hypothetical protein